MRQQAESRVSGVTFGVIFVLASPMVAQSGFLSLYVLMLSDYSRRHALNGSGASWEIASVGIGTLLALGIAVVGFLGGTKSSLGLGSRVYIASAVLTLIVSTGVALVYMSVRQSASLIPRDTIQVEIWDNIVSQLPGGWASAALIWVSPVLAWVGICVCAVASQSRSVSRRITVPVAIGCTVVLTASLLFLVYAVTVAFIGSNRL